MCIYIYIYIYIYLHIHIRFIIVVCHVYVCSCCVVYLKKRTRQGVTKRRNVSSGYMFVMYYIYVSTTFGSRT